MFVCFLELCTVHALCRVRCVSAADPTLTLHTISSVAPTVNQMSSSLAFVFTARDGRQLNKRYSSVWNNGSVCVYTLYHQHTVIK